MQLPLQRCNDARADTLARCGCCGGDPRPHSSPPRTATTPPSPVPRPPPTEGGADSHASGAHGDHVAATRGRGTAHFVAAHSWAPSAGAGARRQAAGRPGRQWMASGWQPECPPLADASRGRCERRRRGGGGATAQEGPPRTAKKLGAGIMTMEVVERGGKGGRGCQRRRKGAACCRRPPRWAHRGRRARTAPAPAAGRHRRGRRRNRAGRVSSRKSMEIAGGAAQPPAAAGPCAGEGARTGTTPRRSRGSGETQRGRPHAHTPASRTASGTAF